MKPKQQTTPVIKRPATLLSLLVVGSFFVLDQLLKHVANAHPSTSFDIIPSVLKWELLHNPGIAFGLPIPNWFLLIITPMILVLLVFLFFHRRQRTTIRVLAIGLIVAGALSNYIDRFLFSITIDYLRVWTSVMNIADIMIVVGASMLVLEQRKRNRKK